VALIGFESLDMALRFFGDSTRLPRARRERSGITEDEVEFLFSLNDRVRRRAERVGDILDVLVFFVEENPRDLVTRAEEIVEQSDDPDPSRATGVLGIRIPVTLARKTQALLYLTVAYHKWPELRFTTGAYPEDIRAAFLDLFGDEQPVFSRF
jgi:hypothetical protein